MFSRVNYTVSVRENQEIGTTIVMVSETIYSIQYIPLHLEMNLDILLSVININEAPVISLIDNV